MPSKNTKIKLKEYSIKIKIYLGSIVEGATVEQTNRIAFKPKKKKTHHGKSS